MSELVFLIEDDPDGGLTARALGEAIFTEAEGMEELRHNIRDAVQCHFEDEATRPKVVRLHYVRDEVMAL
jgi:hypothetical protein